MATSKIVQISSYSRRLRDNIKSILDNYGEMMKAAKARSRHSHFFGLQVESSLSLRLGDGQFGGTGLSNVSRGKRDPSESCQHCELRLSVAYC